MASIELQRMDTLCSDYRGSDTEGDEKLEDDTHTPLFLACKRGHASAVELLLKNGADVSVKDKETGFNCLDIAIENGHQDVAMVIINSDSWKKALRNAVGHRTPMRRMIQKFPDVAHAVLDRCMSDNATEENPDIVNSRNYEVTFDFEFIEDWRTLTRLKRRLNRNNRNVTNTNISDHTSSVASTLDPRDKEKQSNTIRLEREEEEQATKWKPEGLFLRHHPLNLMVKYNRGELLRHPVVSALLDRKWRRYGRNFFIVNLSLYLLFLFFLTLYALLLPRPDHVYCRDYSIVGNVISLPRVNETCPWDNLTFAQGDPTVPMRIVHRVFLYISAAVVLVLGVMRLVYEFLQFVEQRVRYLLNAENYLEVPTFIFAIIFVIQFGMNCWCLTSWQWQLGALAVFFAWLNFILFMKRFPPLGIYVLMYSTIMYTFFRVMVIAILFVIAFSLAFYMILYRAVLNSGILNTSPFRTPGLSIHKTMTMTTGEFDYDTIFGNSEDDKDQLTEFAGLAYFLWIVFLIAMPILLVNLLVGLAVDDAKSIQERAKSRKIEIKVNHALQVQELMRHLLSQGPDIGLKTLHPNRKLKGWERFKNRVWGVERWDSLDSLQKYRKPNLSAVDQIKVQTEKLASEIEEIKDKITSMEQISQKMAKKLGIDEAIE